LALYLRKGGWPYRHNSKLYYFLSCRLKEIEMTWFYLFYYTFL